MAKTELLTAKVDFELDCGRYRNRYRRGDKVLIIPKLTTKDKYCVADDIGVLAYVNKEYLEDVEKTIREAAQAFAKNHPPMRAIDAFVYGAKYMYEKLSRADRNSA